MESELIGRLILLDKNRKFSRLGVFEELKGEKYMCLEKILTPKGEFKAYLENGSENEEFVNKSVEPGDIIRLKGNYCCINDEEIFIAKEGNIISKCKSGRKSPIFDLSTKVKEATILRSNMLKYIRDYFSDKGFMEINTPFLLPFYDGGDADPFETIDKDGKKLFLRETNELIMRRLISCGLGPIYEIGRSFRNIGQGKNTLNEFSVVESAIPYASLSDGIDFAEDLLKKLIKDIGYDKIKLNKKWVRLKFEEEYQILTGKEYNPKKDYLKDRKELSYILKNIKESPAFLIGLPYEISPITSRGKNTLNEAVLSINGDVYCDICHFEVSKKNLKERLEKQQERTKRGNNYFLNFAEYGLVPGVGIAFGLERWMKKIYGMDINKLKNLGGVI